MKKASCYILISLFVLPFMASCASTPKTLIPKFDDDGQRISPSEHVLEQSFPEATEIVHLATCGSSAGPPFMPSRSYTDRTYYIISDHYEAWVDFTIKKWSHKDYYELVNMDIDYTKFDPQALKTTTPESE